MRLCGSPIVYDLVEDFTIRGNLTKKIKKLKRKMSETNERTMRVIRREAKNLLVARGLRADRVHKFYRDELDDALE